MGLIPSSGVESGVCGWLCESSDPNLAFESDIRRSPLSAPLPVQLPPLEEELSTRSYLQMLWAI